MKWAGIILIMFGCSMLGIKKGESCKKHYEEMVYVRKIIVLLRGEMRYNCGEIGEVMANIAPKLKQPYSQMFVEIAEEVNKREGKRFFEIWKEKITDKLDKTELWQKDKEALQELGENMGYLDLEMQLNYLDRYAENLEINIKETKELLKQDIKMYKTLGIMAGIMLSIIII